MKVMKIIKPISIRNLNNGKYILDMGQNFAAAADKSAREKVDREVQLRFAESLKN
jgi:alpha-L-rhamnosidase